MLDVGFPIFQSVHTSVYRYWMVTESIIDSLQKWICRCQLCYSNIVYSQWRSVCWRQMWNTNILGILHAIVCWCWPMIRSITQGLHTCDVSYAHQERVVGQCYANLAKACKNKGRMCVSCKRSKAMVCSIRQGLHPRTWHVRIWQLIFSKDMQHQQSPSCINHIVCTSVGWLQS